MYLAGILGLCALLNASAGSVGSEGPLLARKKWPNCSVRGSASARQEPAKPDSNKPNEPPPSASETKPAENAQPGQSPSEQAPTEKAPAPPAKQQKPSAAKKHKAPPQKTTSDTKNQETKKTVVRKGGTLESTTQLTPGITEEQATRQRQTTQELLASTNAALQKLNGRLLSGDEQATVAQIREFVVQSNAADKAGDLQRAYKLAMKAHLLSDALVKE